MRAPKLVRARCHSLSLDAKINSTPSPPAGSDDGCLKQQNIYQTHVYHNKHFNHVVFRLKQALAAELAVPDQEGDR